MLAWIFYAVGFVLLFHAPHRWLWALLMAPSAIAFAFGVYQYDMLFLFGGLVVSLLVGGIGWLIMSAGRRRKARSA